jgi:hypothetical protein
MTTTASTRSVDPLPSRTGAAGNNFNPCNNHGHDTNFYPVPPAMMNDYTRMQQTMGMQDLPAPPGCNASVRSSTSYGSGLSSSASSVRSNSVPRRQPVAVSGSNHGQGASSGASAGAGLPTRLPTSGVSPVATSMPTSSSINNGDPTSAADAAEQYRIWKQID